MNYASEVLVGERWGDPDHWILSMNLLVRGFEQLVVVRGDDPRVLRCTPQRDKRSVPIIGNRSIGQDSLDRGVDPVAALVELTENSIKLRLSLPYQIRLAGEPIPEAEQRHHPTYKTAEEGKIRGWGVGYAGASKNDEAAGREGGLQFDWEVHSTVQQHGRQSGTSAIAC